MGAVHEGLEGATLEESRLILMPDSLKRFRTGEMLDDHCHPIPTAQNEPVVTLSELIT
jgi:hypothetical protein